MKQFAAVFPGGVLCRRGYEKSQLLTNISLYLRNSTRYGHSYNGRWI